MFIPPPVVGAVIALIRDGHINAATIKDVNIMAIQSRSEKQRRNESRSSVAASEIERM